MAINVIETFTGRRSTQTIDGERTYTRCFHFDTREDGVVVDPTEIRAAPDHMAVVAMGREDQVVVLRCFQHRGARAFLADVEVEDAHHQFLFGQVEHFFLEAPHHEHAIEDGQAGSFA